MLPIAAASAQMRRAAARWFPGIFNFSMRSKHKGDMRKPESAIQGKLKESAQHRANGSTGGERKQGRTLGAKIPLRVEAGTQHPPSQSTGTQQEKSVTPLSG
ncbi:unnamed protein product [Pleuronectes platessa]|uniref:Uncharacterized protein n=1 Tax=Pleuronectes platessa TaxID=8262 RepID=A0A9N7Z7K5_PLEPL|nr:unnamed protein product [Pleuronectes platessa]